ncbi:hypothetical protein Pmani_037128 [Petrolisthes manimaculis]|uniref:Uncharacterized protein n=1 Tax=Petrolisthes manimaculis TaxID=1843537 RepID=A0AAE1TLR2_9EUCA|nr:hypothetical protein Pmani_037128 [Petrolisthes manimaculis]
MSSISGSEERQSGRRNLRQSKQKEEEEKEGVCGGRKGAQGSGNKKMIMKRETKVTKNVGRQKKLVERKKMMTVAEMKKQSDNYDGSDGERIVRKIRQSLGNISVIKKVEDFTNNLLLEEGRRKTKGKESAKMRVEAMGKVSMSRQRFARMRKWILGENQRPTTRRRPATVDDLETSGVTTRKMQEDQEKKNEIIEARWSMHIRESDIEDSVRIGSLDWARDELRLYPLPEMT